MMMSYNVINRYTSRITEMLVVLADLEKGEYRRTMVKPEQQKIADAEGKDCHTARKLKWEGRTIKCRREELKFWLL